MHNCPMSGQFFDNTQLLESNILEGHQSMENHFPVRFAARISVTKAAQLLGVHRNTLVRSWFKEKGLINLQKSPTGRWLVEVREVERVLRSPRYGSRHPESAPDSHNRN